MTNDKQFVPTARQDGIAEQPKKPYAAPVLRTYGSVSALTLTKPGTTVDGPQTMVQTSDRRAKENIVQVGKHPLGIGLYLFDYKPEYRAACGHGRRLGVMADEVETVRPDAVLMHADGYKMVDYGKLN